MKLIPLSMRRPNKEFIQAPSKIRPSVEISPEELREIAGNGKEVNVSMEKDGVSNPQKVTAYTLPVIGKTETGHSALWPGRFIISED